MILAGTITKIDGEKAWALVRPEGGTCADCSCDKPTRVIQGWLDSPDAEVAVGDQCVVESNEAWSGLSATVLGVLSVTGAVLAWNLAPGTETIKALASLGGLTTGALLAILIMTPFRRRQQARVKKVSVEFFAGSTCKDVD